MGDKFPAIFSLILTVILGLCFLAIQYTEYIWSEFTIADSVFGTVFYMTTGLHGIHVLAGVSF